MRSKDDFIKENHAFTQITGTSDDGDNNPENRMMMKRKDLHALLDEYAKDVALDALKWIRQIGCKQSSLTWLFPANPNYVSKTDEGIIDEYLKSKTNNQ